MRKESKKLNNFHPLFWITADIFEKYLAKYIVINMLLFFLIGMKIAG